MMDSLIYNDNYEMNKDGFMRIVTPVIKSTNCCCDANTSAWAQQAYLNCIASHGYDSSHGNDWTKWIECLNLTISSEELASIDKEEETMSVNIYEVKKRLIFTTSVA